MKKLNSKAFTLVELIVVITIIAILGTIAFISLQGYSRDSRNSKRIADLNSIQKSLELYITEKGTYPLPDSSADISYSGSIAWVEGTVGDLVMRNLEKINKKPLDPLTGNEYTYSITSGKTEYQLGAIKEGGLIGYELPLNQTYAAIEKKATAMIRGNYNERFLKVKSGSLNWLVAMPTIITSDLREIDLQGQLNNKLLVFSNYGNLPHSYNNLGYAMTGGFDYTNTNPLVYSGSINSLLEDNNKLIFIDNLKEAYNGTVIQGEPNYQDIVNTDTGTNQTGAIYLVNNFINTDVGGLNPGNVILPVNNSQNNTVSGQWKDIPGTNCTNDDYIFTLAGTTYTWAGCNSILGTTGISTNADVYNGNCYSYESFTSPTTTTNCDASHMIYTAKENLYNPSNGEDNIWGKSYLRANAIQENNACPTGWHVPTDLEFEKLETYLNGGVNCRNSTDGYLCEGLGWLGKSIKTTSNNIIKALKLPLAGYWYNGNFFSRGLYGYLWVSDQKDANLGIGRLLYSDNNTIFRFNRNKSVYGFTVRCIKGISTPPPSSYTCATQPSYTHATFTSGTPTQDNQAWQNTSNSTPCYYVCTDGYTGNDCSTPPSGPVACLLNPSEVDTLNGLLSVSSINAYDLEWNPITPSTETEWCDDVRGIEWFGGSSLPNELWNLTNLTFLNLQSNGITSLPIEIGNLTNLTGLQLTNNSISSLPTVIGNLTNLTGLRAESNSLTSIPTEIGNLTNLESLGLDNNNIVNLPTEIGNLTNLMVLGLQGTSLSTFPTQIGNLTNLLHLYIGSNSLTSLPTEIGNLTNLVVLNLQGNSLTTLPTEIGNLTNLYSLRLGDNSLTTLPVEIGNLTNLNGLRVGNNSLTSIPTTIGNLTNLQTLGIDYNSLTNLPVEIWNLTNLTRLYLQGNSFTSLPTGIGNLNKLTNLTLQSNSLTSLPTTIGNLTNLTNLALENNDIVNLPAEIGNLNKLTSLRLQGNALTTLPTEIRNLINLTYLMLSNNTSLGNLSYYFVSNTSNRSQLNIPTTGQTMTIGGNGTKIVITVTP